MFIDTHCHISREDYEDIDKVIKDDFDSGCSAILIIGCTSGMIKEALEIANSHSEIYAAIGYHPDQASIYTEEDLIKLEELLKNNKVVAIGEIGLDYHYGKDDKDKQLELFEYQLRLAEKYNLPVSIHSRDAVKDTIDILSKYKVKGSIHCFSGSLEVAKIYIKMGFYLGIGGVVTFKNSNLHKVIEEIGLDNIVLETDSPYLAPVPVRGSVNTSKNIFYIASYLAELLKIPVEDVYSITSNNANFLFDFKK